jgi:two-component system response regulator DevR
VLDDWLPDGNGVELCRDLLSSMPDLRCLMLASSTSDEAMLYAILAGGSGYAVKNIMGMQLACAIKDVGAGRSLLGTRAAAALLTRLWRLGEGSDGPSLLDERDREWLSFVADGLTNRQIADRTSLGEDAVKRHVSRLLVKLGVTRQPNRFHRQGL